MPKLEIRVILTDSDDDEITCNRLDLQKLLRVCEGMANFNDQTFLPYDMWVESNHNLGVELDNGTFYISFADAQAYIDLIQKHLGAQEQPTSY